MVPAVLLWGLYFLLPRFGFAWTWTGSLPIGLWRYNTQGVQSHYIAFCLPDGVYSHFFRDHVMSSDDHSPYPCPNNTSVFIKPVMARPGDQVELSSAAVRVNGVPLPRTATQQRSRKKGVVIPHISRGRYTTQSGTVWVFSTYNEASFDSRYYGPIDVRWIRSGAEPVLVYTDNPDYTLVTSGAVHCLWRFCWVAR